MRPFDIRRDLLPLADLIELAFRSEIDLTGHNIAADMRRLASTGPLLWLAAGVSAVPVPVLAGYVWTVGDQLVGNVTLTLENLRLGRWSISNVAVHPDFTRRGIATQLMRHALDQAFTRGARRVVLEVQSDNTAAQRMYQSLGFERHDTVVELRMPATSLTAWSGTCAQALRPRRDRDWHGLSELYAATVPPEARETSPAEPHQYRLSLAARCQRWLDSLLRQRRRTDWVLEDSGRIVALLQVIGQYGSAAHRLQLRVLPAYRGPLEQELVAAGMAELRRFPAREVAASVSRSHPEAEQAFHKAGFNTVRILDQMWLDARRDMNGNA